MVKDPSLRTRVGPDGRREWVHPNDPPEAPKPSGKALLREALAVMPRCAHWRGCRRPATHGPDGCPWCCAGHAAGHPPAEPVANAVAAAEAALREVT